MFTDHTIGDGNALYKATMIWSCKVQDYLLNRGIDFVTHFNACRCDVFYSDNLEQIAVAFFFFFLLIFLFFINALQHKC